MRPENENPAGEDMQWEVDEKAAAEAILNGIPKDCRRGLTRRVSMAPRSYAAAVFLKCMDCCAWDRKEVQLCQITGCPLHPHRTRLFKPQVKKASVRQPREAKPDLAETA